MFAQKNKGFWELLELSRALYANKDEPSYICITFTKLHSEKKIRWYCSKSYIKFYKFHILFLEQESINMNKSRVKVKKKKNLPKFKRHANKQKTSLAQNFIPIKLLVFQQQEGFLIRNRRNL